MKMVARVLFMAIFCSCLLSGCGRKTLVEQFTVYSFSGENELFSISNGVIVLTSTEETFYGGNLEEKHGTFSDVVACSMSFYILSGNEERILLSNDVEDMTGGMIDISGEIGKVSGDIIKAAEMETLQNNLFFKLKTSHLNGEENEYQLQLTLTKITAGK